MRYLITASNRIYRHTLRAMSLPKAAAILSLLRKAGFWIEHVMDEQGQNVLVQDVRQVAMDEGVDDLDWVKEGQVWGECGDAEVSTDWRATPRQSPAINVDEAEAEQRQQPVGLCSLTSF